MDDMLFGDVEYGDGAFVSINDSLSVNVPSYGYTVLIDLDTVIMEDSAYLGDAVFAKPVDDASKICMDLHNLGVRVVVATLRPYDCVSRYLSENAIFYDHVCHDERADSVWNGKCPFWKGMKDAFEYVKEDYAKRKPKAEERD